MLKIAQLLNTDKLNEKQLAYVEIHFCVFLWGFTAIFGKLIEVSELPLVWFRLLITCISLLFIPNFFTTIKNTPKKEFLNLAFIGCLVSLHWLFFYASIKYSNASVGVVCMSTISLFTSIIEPLFFGKKFKISEAFFASVVILGMYLVFYSASFYLTGIILGLIGALFSSIFTILNKKAVAKVSPLSMTFGELGSGLIFITLLSPIYYHYFPTAIYIPSGKDVFYLIILSLLCTTLPFNLSLKALKHITAFTANFAVNLEPIYGVILAIIIFHENKELGLNFYLGTLIILLAVFTQGIISSIGKKYSKSLSTG